MFEGVLELQSVVVKHFSFFWFFQFGGAFLVCGVAGGLWRTVDGDVGELLLVWLA